MRALLVLLVAKVAPSSQVLMTLMMMLMTAIAIHAQLPPSMPPLMPGVLSSVVELIAKANASGLPVQISLAPGTIITLSGEPLTIGPGMNVTIRSSGAGATIDAMQLSRVVHIHDGGHLEVQQIHLVNGTVADAAGGCVLVDGGGSTLRMGGGSVTDCIAAVVAMSDAIPPYAPTTIGAGGGVASINGAEALVSGKSEELSSPR